TELRDEGTRLYCPNAACSKRLHHRIEKWVNVLDIRDFGVTLIKRLYEIKRLASISDIYTLKEEELAELDGLGAKSAKKIIASIQSRRTITLAQFIAGFDIENIGETLAEKLIEAGFTDLSALLNAGEDDIARVPGFAKITAGILCRGLEECRHEMLFLTENNIINIKTITNDALLAGKTFCFTGELHTMKRSEAEKAVKQAGGSVKSSVGKGLSFLVTNDVSSQSAKNKKAHELGIPIINEEEFLDIAQVNR
ncbi:MAG: helix-hairpin-helix domain-containing protein, partial [Spirochaetales bacterium]